MTDSWDEQVDLLVLGSGAGGLAAAAVGAQERLDVLVLEKTEWLGGTTALSAGTAWIPGHRHQQDPQADSADAHAYLDALVGDRAPRGLRESYLAHGPEMIDYLEKIGVGFWHSATVVDYHPEIPGYGTGRALEPRTFDGRRLGKARFGRVRRPVPEFALFRGTLMVRRAEANELLTIFRGSVRGMATALRLGVRWAQDMLRYPRGTRLAMGNALTANLYHQLLRRGGDVWFTAQTAELVADDAGRVIGAVVSHNGRTVRVAASAGVVLATGGSPQAPSCAPAICRGLPRSSHEPRRAPPATRSPLPAQSAPQSGNLRATTPCGSQAPSGAAGTVPPRSSPTSGTGPSPASSRSTPPDAGSWTNQCPTTASPAPCTDPTPPCPRFPPGS